MITFSKNTHKANLVEDRKTKFKVRCELKKITQGSYLLTDHFQKIIILVYLTFYFSSIGANFTVLIGPTEYLLIRRSEFFILLTIEKENTVVIL